MGHSSINVSLTYLRGLEVPELNEDHDIKNIRFMVNISDDFSS